MGIVTGFLIVGFLVIIFLSGLILEVEGSIIIMDFLVAAGILVIAGFLVATDLIVTVFLSGLILKSSISIGKVANKSEVEEIRAFIFNINIIMKENWV